MAATRVRSLKEAQQRRSQELREVGMTWADIAGIFRMEYGVNARVGHRLARGWSQREAADRWNERWPDDPKTFKNFSYWEQWPNKSGYAPSLDVLSRLAELYSCHISDLLSDGPAFNHLDSSYQHRSELEKLPRAVAAAADETKTSESDAGRDLAQFIQRLHDSEVDELARVASEWSKHVGGAIDRRSLLLKLSFALTTAATLQGSDTVQHSTTQLAKNKASGLSGIWRSEYGYYSSRRDQHNTDTHYVVVRQAGDALTIESLRHSTGSELKLNVSLDGMFATGTWEEKTSPTGYYKGAIYRGAIQLLVSPSLTAMTGKWIGFGKNFSINNGDWSFTLETRDTSPADLRAYSGKL
jgi:transcriptional regulator with XRE-family HTH domain